MERPVIDKRDDGVAIYFHIPDILLQPIKNNDDVPVIECPDYEGDDYFLDCEEDDD